MPPAAYNPAAEPAPSRGTAASFRLLTVRLKRSAAPAEQGPAAEERLHPSPAPRPVIPTDPGEAAAALLDIIWGAMDLPPQERSMAGDTLLLLLPRLSERDLAGLAERIAAMDQPPPLVVSQLLRDPRPDIGGVVLEHSANLGTDELLHACRDAGPERLQLLARRRSVPPQVSDLLVRSGDLLSLLALLRNPGAEISYMGFLALSQMAGEHPGLQAPLALRTDLPLSVALDLLWRLPPELRRLIIARFLSDSVTLGRILSLALAAAQTPVPAEAAPSAETDAALRLLVSGRRAEAAARMAELAGISAATVERIFSDAEGEALVVLLKALGFGRARFDMALERLREAAGILRGDRPQEDLKAVFDALSFTKARVLLIYWEWFTRRAGPYAAAPGPGSC